MDKKESFYWDLVKGTAIFLMLWGHCIQYCALDRVNYFEDIVFKTIYTFHMPVFMLVSGYLFFHSFRKRECRDLLERRMRGMLQPIVMGTLLNNLLMLIPTYVLSNRVTFLFGSLFHGIETDLWFLWAVLYCSLVVGVCGKLTDNPCLRLLLLLFGGFALLLVPQWNMTLFMYPYFVVGFYWAMYREQARKLCRSLRYVALVLFPVMVACYETEHYIYITPMFSRELGLTASAGIALFRWAIGFVGSLCFLTVMELVQRLGEKCPAVRTFFGGISCLGRNSLQIYCLSASLLSGYLPHLYRKAVELVGRDLFSGNWLAYDFLLTPILAAVWSVFLYGAVLLLKKLRLHTLIFGR